jgi:hypothetical protein
MALWESRRRAISWAKAVSAVSEKDFCVLKFVSFGRVWFGASWLVFAEYSVATDCSAIFLG